MRMHTPILLLVALLVGSASAQTPDAARPNAPAGAPSPAASQAALKAAPVPAQTAPRPGEIETAPIRCWWRTDRAEIRIGERFAITLTCGVIETRSLQVVPSVNQLDPGAVQLTPFEVVAGTRREDIVAPPWRYLQYEYSVRLLSEGFFGQDIVVPSLNVTYNIRAAAGNGAQGRDQTYVLPALPVRVAMLVPKDASDIRDASTEGFAAIAERRARATNAAVAGGIFFAVAGVLVVLGLVRAFGGIRQRKPGALKPVSPVIALHGALRQLGQVKADVARDGWSPERARKAVAILRIASAIGLRRPLAQAVAVRETPERDGQLKLRHGLLRPRWTVVSGAVTPQTIERALAEVPSPLSPSVRAAVEQIRSALTVLGSAGYGRGGELDTIALDGALGEGSEAIRQLRRRSIWSVGAAPAAPPSASGLPAPTPLT